jgi:hypothetical protein
MTNLSVQTGTCLHNAGPLCCKVWDTWSLEIPFKFPARSLVFWGPGYWQPGMSKGLFLYVVLPYFHFSASKTVLYWHGTFFRNWLLWGLGRKLGRSPFCPQTLQCTLYLTFSYLIRPEFCPQCRRIGGQISFFPKGIVDDGVLFGLGVGVGIKSRSKRKKRTPSQC